MLPQSDVRNLANAKGIISLTQRSAEQDDGSADPKAPNTKLAAECMADPPWTLPEMSKRRVWVNTYAWTTSQVASDTIVKLTAPWDFLTNYLQQAPFERYLYYNGSMKLRIHVNGTRFHAGRLIAYFVPWTRAGVVTNWHQAHMAAAWGVPNVFLDATANNEGVLDIPFYNPKSFLVLNGPYDQNSDFTGTFVLQVLAPLQAATGTSPTINVNLWVEFDTDSQFRVPLHTANTSRAFNAIHQGQMTERVNMLPQGNSMSSVTNVSNYGTIDGMTVPTEMTGDSIGNGNQASGLPMDKPGYMANPIPTRLKAMQNLASTVGTELVTRLDLDPSQQNLSISEMFSTETDEMEMKFLTTRPTYFTTINWATTQAVGTSLGAWFLGPLASLFLNGTVNQLPMIENTSTLPMTQWDYVSSMFKFWRGGLKIRFDIIATQFHTGRLFLALNYGAAPDSETGLRDATSQYGVEIDLQNEKHTFEFNIPYNTNVPWLEVCRGPKGPKETDKYWFTRYFLGSWNLRVLNALVAPENVANNVNIIVSLAGADDFVLYYPSFNNTCFYILNTTSVSEEEKQEDRILMKPQGDTGEMAGEDAVKVPTATEGQTDNGIPIAPPRAAVKFPHAHFGPRAGITHLGQFLKRYQALPTPSKYLTYSKAGIIGQTGITTLSQAFTDTFVPDEGSTNPSLWVGYTVMPISAVFDGYSSLRYKFANMYRFWRGSVRFKAYFQDLADYKNVPLQCTSYGSVYIPGIPNSNAGNANWSLIAANLACVTDYQQMGATTAFFYSEAVPSLAADVALNVAPYTEIEIPFTTIYNVLATPFNNVSDLEAPYLDPGYVMFFYRFSYSGAADDMTALRTNGISGIPKILTAMGDDFRLGTFKGIPPIVTRNVYNEATSLAATGPMDTWVISQPTAEPTIPEETPTDWELLNGQRRPPESMTESMIAEALNIVKQKRVQMLPQGDRDDEDLGRFCFRRKQKSPLDIDQNDMHDRYSSCYCFDVALVNSITEIPDAELPQSIRLYKTLVRLLYARLELERKDGEYPYMPIYLTFIAQKFGIQFVKHVEPDLMKAERMWISAEWQMPSFCGTPKFTLPRCVQYHNPYMVVGMTEMDTLLVSEITTFAQAEIAKFLNTSLVLSCYTTEERAEAVENRKMPREIRPPEIPEEEKTYKEKTSLVNSTILMTPQVGLTEKLAIARLFEAFKKRSHFNERAKLNELKSIFGFDMDFTAISDGPDNNKIWVMDLKITGSQFPEFNNMSARGSGKGKSTATEDASKKLNNQFLEIADTMVKSWRRADLELRTKEFNERHPLKAEGAVTPPIQIPSNEEERVVLTDELSAQTVVVESTEQRLGDVRSSELPETQQSGSTTHRNRPDVLLPDVQSLLACKVTMQKDLTPWKSYQAQEPTGLWKTLDQYGIEYKTNIMKGKAPSLFKYSVVLSCDEAMGVHDGYAETLVYAPIDEDDAWDWAIGTTTLRALDKIIDEKQRGWTTIGQNKQ